MDVQQCIAFCIVAIVRHILAVPQYHVVDHIASVLLVYAWYSMMFLQVLVSDSLDSYMVSLVYMASAITTYFAEEHR